METECIQVYYILDRAKIKEKNTLFLTVWVHLIRKAALSASRCFTASFVHFRVIPPNENDVANSCKYDLSPCFVMAELLLSMIELEKCPF